MFLKWINIPTKDEWIFSIRSFIGAMVGFYLAQRIGLPRPFWALLSAYVTAQTFAGTTKAKAFYRVIGSTIGAFGIVLLIPLFFNYSLLAALSLGLWYGFWIFVALHDRTPRAYAFLLGGYTVGIVAMPSMSDASQITLPIFFDMAINRVQEIGLGVGCSALAHAIIFPMRVGNAIIKQLDQALTETFQNIRNIIDYTREFTDQRPNLNKLSSTITNLRILTTTVPFEAENLRWVHNIVGSLQDRLSALVPLLSSVDDRIRYLRQTNEGLPQGLQDILDDISRWISKGGENPYAEAIRIRRRIAHFMPTITANSGWNDMLATNFADALYYLVDIGEDCFGLRRRINEGLTGKEPDTEEKERKVSTLSLMIDKRKAWASAFAAFACVTLTTLMWIVSGWNTFWAAPMMGGMYCLFFSAVDTPVPMLKGQFWMTAYSAIPAGLYLLWLLPSAHSFEMMMMLFFPFFIYMGTYLMMPAKALVGVPFFLTTIATLTMFDQGSANPTAFINVQISQCIGILFAILFMGICRSITIQSFIADVVKGVWRDISELATMKNIPSQVQIAVKMVDGVSLITPRLAIAQKDHESSRSGKLQSAVNILLDLRVCMNMARLLRAESHLDLAGPSPFRTLIAKLSSYYGAGKEIPRAEFESFLGDIDQALHEAASLPSNNPQNMAVCALTGLRCDLFPTASPYVPETTVSRNQV
ncbi:MAG: FUSC family protein [Oxalobacter sp.]